MKDIHQTNTKEKRYYIGTGYVLIGGIKRGEGLVIDELIDKEPKQVQSEVIPYAGCDIKQHDRGDGVFVADEVPIYPESAFYTLDIEKAYFYGRIDEVEDEAWSGQFLDLARDTYFINFTGYKRSGKTLLAVYFAMKCMALYNMPVWSNCEIHFKVRNRHGKINEYKSLPFDLLALARLDEDMKHGIVLIDEFPMFMNSKSAMSTKNKLFGLAMSQLGKQKLNVFTTSQNSRWIDGVVSWQLDVEIQCSDASRKYPRSGLRRGQTIFWGAIDLSGLWTGIGFQERPIIYQSELANADLVWAAYKSYEVVSPVEAYRPIRVDLAPTVVTDKKDKYGVDAQLQSYLDNLKINNIKRFSLDETSVALDVRQYGVKLRIAHLLKEWGYTRHQSTGGVYFYEFPGK